VGGCSFYVYNYIIIDLVLQFTIADSNIKHIKNELSTNISTSYPHFLFFLRSGVWSNYRKSPENRGNRAFDGICQKIQFNG
jgi:hypothetical protein